MAYQLWLDFGAGFVEYTDSLYGRFPMRRQRAIYNELKPVISTCKFSLIRNTALVTQLLTTSADIPIRILDGETPYFVGYVRPTVKATIDGSRGLEAIEIEAVDLWYKLDRTVGTTRTINGWAVSDPSNKAESLLHQIFYDAGIADSELSLAAVTATVPSITLAAGSGTYRPIIEQILAEAGYSARVSAAGVVSLYDLGPATITPVLTLSSGVSGNLAAGYKLERKEATAEAVDVEYYVTKALSGAMLFEDTTGATAGLDASISVPAGTYYPNGAASGKSVKAAMRIDGYDLVSASNVISNIAYNGVLTVQEFAGEGKNILMRLYSASGAVITRLRGYGDAIVKGDLRRVVRENVASTTKREKVEFKYLADDTSAARVARIRALRHLHGAYRWSLTSTELSLTPGDYVSLNEAAVLGASTTLRIVSVVDGPDPKTISVEAEGVAEYTADAVATETETNQPPSPSPAAEIREAAMKSAIELAQKTLTLSAPAISRSRADALSPAAVTASAKNADGTAYAGRLVLALSHDGGATWSTVYTSSTDESSHEYTVSAAIEIESVVYYVTAIRASLYAAGGTTTLLREVTVPVALDSSASGIYFGSYDSSGGWPASGMIFGDTLWDNRESSLGGGIIRYWDDSEWSVAPALWAGYHQAIKLAIDDIAAWVAAYGGSVAEVSAFMNAIINNAIIKNGIIDFLATSTQVSTALCKDGITRRASIMWDDGEIELNDFAQSKQIRLRDAVLESKEGAGNNRRGVRQIGSGFDFVDYDDSGNPYPSAYIYREASSFKRVVLHGKFVTPVETPFSAVEHTIYSVTRSFPDVAWSPELGLFCAIMSGVAVCMTSPDGITWTERTISATSRNWSAVEWSPELGLFCIIASSSTVCATSPDGVTWTERTISATSRGWLGLAWSPELGIFCALAGPYSAISSDGLTWEEYTNPYECTHLAWSSKLGLFCAVESSYGRAATSPDGITWTLRTVSATLRSWLAIEWSPELGLFCAIASSSTVCATSPDGITWTERTISATSRNWSAVEWSPELGLFCIIASSSTVCATSPDGVTWTERTISATSRGWLGLAWSPELGVLCITAASSTVSATIQAFIYGRLGSGIVESDEDDSSPIDTFGNGHIYRPNGDRYELFGVARFDGTNWYLIDDTGHHPYGIASIENLAAGGFRIYYDKSAGHVGTLIAVPDETYAQAGVIAGSSVGDEYSDVILAGEYLDKSPSTKMALHFMSGTNNYGYIAYNGSSWVHSSSAGISSLSFDTSTGYLTITHAAASPAGLFSITGRDNSYDRPVFVTYSATTTVVKFYGKGRIPNANLALSGSNIWLYGKMHVD